MFAPVDKLVDQLGGVDIIMSGVPLPLMIRVEARPAADRIAKRCGKPVTSSVVGVVAAPTSRLASHRARQQMVGADESRLGECCGGRGRRASSAVAGAIQKISTADNMALAFELGRAAFTLPGGGRLYIGGGAGSEPVCKRWSVIRKPAISNAVADRTAQPARPLFDSGQDAHWKQLFCEVRVTSRRLNTNLGKSAGSYDSSRFSI